MRVAHPVFGKNFNITMDNWFSSLQTAKQLFQNGTTMVETMRKDKREVPLFHFERQEGIPYIHQNLDSIHLAH
ncbi:hypothetical protein HF086_007404 [Spodoptera exigua]|uniref:PiggyBac transposable element-derived protein domain-containing protein n=1 Tax=Spodoptera exigua TaxID=7107 RepID=A0A922MKT9_SPOEX|nr:hypothetical protein HF086_007404 [Spodoptera exigua]